MRFIRKAGAPAEKSPKRLYVEPAELARKLVKEMDDHAVTKGQRVWVRDHYTVYLCPEDFKNLNPREYEIIPDLTKKLAKHATEMGYSLQDDLVVDMVRDPDLELGYFGILAHPGYAEEPVPQPVAPPGRPDLDAQQAPPLAVPGVMPAAEPAVGGGAKVAAAAAAAAAGVASEPDRAEEFDFPARTEVIAAEQADELGLARRVIVITSGDRVREFTQSRVIIGRSREADLRIDDPNVSRKHAAIYWSDGKLMLDDLGSTNGTMVNGYPVTRTALRPRDVVAIGESRLTVESR